MTQSLHKPTKTSQPDTMAMPSPKKSDAQIVEKITLKIAIISNT